MIFKNYDNKRISRFPSTIIGHLFNVIRGHRPANLDCRIASGNDYRVKNVTSGNDYRVVQSGRSMIEMLGVLAIIAVLSVGGIAGYSKAMAKWKINKAISEYSYLIYGMLEQYDSIKKMTVGDLYGLPLFPIADSLNLVPENWQKVDNFSYKDSLENQVDFVAWNLENNTTYMTLAFYWGDFEKSNILLSELCTEFISNLIKPLHSTVYRMRISDRYNGENAYYGDNVCSSDKKCLNSLELAEINNICSCFSNKNTQCTLVVEF